MWFKIDNKSKNILDFSVIQNSIIETMQCKYCSTTFLKARNWNFAFLHVKY